MSQTNYNHQHKYEAVTAEKRSFRCVVTGCRHVITRGLIVGRMCACWSCDEMMEVTDDRINNKHITHKNCHKNSPTPQGSKESVSVADLIQGMKGSKAKSKATPTEPNGSSVNAGSTSS